MSDVKQYRKKPVIINAIQYDGQNGSDIFHIFAGHLSNYDDYMEIDTLEGRMRAEVGDWIIEGIKGEVYPCKPDIFEATYEAVDLSGEPPTSKQASQSGPSLPEGEE